MALTDENNGGIGATMLVGPAGVPTYGYPMGGGFGGGFCGNGDWSWIIVLFLFAMMGGWGNGGFGGGFGGFGGGNEFAWLLNGQNGINNNVSDGFREAQLHDSVTSVRDGISQLSTQLCGCCGDMQMALANGFAGTTAAITGAQNALAQQLYSNEIASLNRSFAEQTANTAGFTAVNNGIADTRYTIATEACATRTTDTQNTQNILTALTAGVQSIKDQLCKDKIDAKNDEISALRQQIAMKDLAASQVAQNAFISQGFANEVDALYNRLSNCPVPSTPVYGRTPIFTCNNGCGCGCGNSANF